MKELASFSIQIPSFWLPLPFCQIRKHHLTASPSCWKQRTAFLLSISPRLQLAEPFALTMNTLKGITNTKRRCEITIISFSRSICRGGFAALIGVTRKPYPGCLSCHSHPIRPCGAPSPRGEGCDTRIPSSKKRRRSRHLNPEPNESKVKRSCEEMRIHFFTAPFFYAPHHG